jgi:hypothetical protein
MRKIINFFMLFVLLLITSQTFAQAPEKFSYQAVCRSSTGTIIASQAVSLRFSIHDLTAVGTVVYQETQSATTNTFGLVNLEVGAGSIITGVFASIPWGTGAKYLEIELDPAGGASFVSVGAPQLISVPYAIYANQSGTAGPTGPTGPAGPVGADGINGSNGTNGVDGINGTNGATGPQGPAGVNGTNGTNGIDGINGVTGAQGPTGVNGTNGVTGAQGPTGAAGTNGTNGAAGVQGPTGAAGTNGTNGATGAQGPTGANGVTGATGPLVAGVSTQTLRHDGTSWVANSTITNNGTNIGIGAAPSISYGLYTYDQQLTANGDGQASIYAFRNRDSQNDGTGYDIYSTNNGITGYNYWGDLYTFGVFGQSFGDYNRTGGVAGYCGGSWGSLGYKTSASAYYGVYGSGAYANGAGKSTQNANVSTSIGGGFFGDLFGADIHGKVYGTYTQGGSYGLYSNGNIYTNALNIQLQEVNQSSKKYSQSSNSSNMAVLYSIVSTDVTIQTAGTAKLINGTCQVSFDKTFSNVVSSQNPLVVTVTPTGNSNGVYVTEVTKNGFTVRENNNGTSTVDISFIVMGRRAGYENPQLPAEVISNDYTTKIANGLHNDNDTSTNGEGLYYEGGQLKNGIHPSLLPDPNKSKVDSSQPKQIKNSK